MCPGGESLVIFAIELIALLHVVSQVSLCSKVMCMINTYKLYSFGTHQIAYHPHSNLYTLIVSQMCTLKGTSKFNSCKCRLPLENVSYGKFPIFCSFCNIYARCIHGPIGMFLPPSTSCLDIEWGRLQLFYCSHLHKSRL